MAALSAEFAWPGANCVSAHKRTKATSFFFFMYLLQFVEQSPLALTELAELNEYQLKLDFQNCRRDPNICPKCHFNPSNSWDISVWNKLLDWPIAIHKVLFGAMMKNWRGEQTEPQNVFYRQLKLSDWRSKQAVASTISLPPKHHPQIWLYVCKRVKQSLYPQLNLKE